MTQIEMENEIKLLKYQIQLLTAMMSDISKPHGFYDFLIDHNISKEEVQAILHALSLMGYILNGLSVPEIWKNDPVATKLMKTDHPDQDFSDFIAALFSNKQPEINVKYLLEATKTQFHCRTCEELLAMPALKK